MVFIVPRQSRRQQQQIVTTETSKVRYVMLLLRVTKIQLFNPSISIIFVLKKPYTSLHFSRILSPSIHRYQKPANHRFFPFPISTLFICLYISPMHHQYRTHTHARFDVDDDYGTTFWMRVRACFTSSMCHGGLKVQFDTHTHAFTDA